MTGTDGLRPTAEPMSLLPCPFCGGPVYLEQTIDRRKWWGVVCRNTRNRGGTCAIEQCPSASPEAAVERWNMRGGVEAALRAENERLREALRCFEHSDSIDWEHLFRFLPESGHGKFWRAVLREFYSKWPDIRTALNGGKHE